MSRDRWNRSWVAVLTLFLGATLAHGETGVISGSVTTGVGIKEVFAVNRDQPERKYPGRFDAKSGRFGVQNLPLGASYDLILDTGTARLEGVNLKVPHSEYEEEQPLTKDDVQKIESVIQSLNKFDNKVAVLAVVGNIQHAAAVVDKLRTQAFVNSQPGEVVWRLEVVHFERPEETWIKRQEELAVVHYRKRIQKSEFDKLAITLEPALGGIELTAGKPRVDLPTVAGPVSEPGVRMRKKESQDVDRQRPGE